MRIPADWDSPSPDNERLCEKFKYGTFEDQGRLPYRLFRPASGSSGESEEKFPIVVYLHGADAFGNDNEAQLAMHDIGTVFARDSWQEKDPCYILAPQCKPSGHWAGPESGKRLISLIKGLMQENPDIDKERIYIYGYSAGGIGTLRLIKSNPEFFAAAFPICGATGDDDMDKLTRTPIWMMHAADDEIVKVSYCYGGVTGSNLGSRDIYEDLKDSAPDLHYTEFPEGYLKSHYGINPHCTWVPAAEAEEIKKWMFSKRRGAESFTEVGKETL